MRYILALLAILFLCGTTLLGSQFYPGGYAFAQAPSAQSGSIWNLCLLAVLMLSGIVSSFVFEQAKTMKPEAGGVGAKLKAVLTDYRLVAAIFVSPLIFNSVYSLVHQNPQGLSDYLLAFQNGFFWQSVIVGVVPKGQRATPSRRVASSGRS
jgi:hypothetical protein